MIYQAHTLTMKQLGVEGASAPPLRLAIKIIFHLILSPRLPLFFQLYQMVALQSATFDPSPQISLFLNSVIM